MDGGHSPTSRKYSGPGVFHHADGLWTRGEDELGKSESNSLTYFFFFQTDFLEFVALTPAAPLARKNTTQRQDKEQLKSQVNFFQYVLTKDSFQSMNAMLTPNIDEALLNRFCPSLP